ncbi:Initiation-specific alpha-1,6-mannosyltransferase [Elsinoe australis]|uniref:Initiation-specific alpha-1,6-mannosyltransferase n=1 Tax=Elsinoe australis TaxID=40998 RepID=A0A2P7ZDV9_9PEZI|nr:Initiation-specific alpha-1,6-mannosyltransferase [Elsinoe australis]
MATTSRSPRFYIPLALFILILLFLTTSHVTSGSLPLPNLHSITRLSPYSINRKPLVPRLIWQTYGLQTGEGPPPEPEKELQRLPRSWTDRNPFYTYTRLQGDTAIEYIRARFSHRPDIIETYESVNEYVLRADMIRYLILSADGGTYADYDTECVKSIDLWSGEHDFTKVGMILGLEYDQRNDKNLMPGTAYRVQFNQWTLSSRPGHPIMDLVRDKVFESVGEALERTGGINLTAQNEVLDMTGPKIFTAAVHEGIEKMLGREVDLKEFSMLPGPKLFGDVLVFPINAFASGVPHSGAKDHGNEEQLVHHWFRGTWKHGLDG